MEQGYLEQVGTDGSRREPSLAKNVGNMMSPGGACGWRRGGGGGGGRRGEGLRVPYAA